MLLLLLLVLIQINTSNLVDAKEDVSSSEKETKTGEKEEKTSEKEGKTSEKEEKTSEKEEKDKDEEDEEDTCLSSPCGSHARCKNVQVCLGVHTWGKNATNVIICDSRMRCNLLYQHFGSRLWTSRASLTGIFYEHIYILCSVEGLKESSTNWFCADVCKTSNNESGWGQWAIKGENRVLVGDVRMCRFL